MAREAKNVDNKSNSKVMLVNPTFPTSYVDLDGVNVLDLTESYLFSCHFAGEALSPV